MALDVSYVLAAPGNCFALDLSKYALGGSPVCPALAAQRSLQLISALVIAILLESTCGQSLCICIFKPAHPSTDLFKTPPLLCRCCCQHAITDFMMCRYCMLSLIYAFHLQVSVSKRLDTECHNIILESII
jgi:hypothetical protein